MIPTEVFAYEGTKRHLRGVGDPGVRQREEDRQAGGRQAGHHEAIRQQAQEGLRGGGAAMPQARDLRPSEPA